MGARTSAAQAEVVAAREALAAETGRLGTATREAVDIPAKVRRAPLKSAAFAGAAAFLVLGGPGRVLGRAKRAVLGAPPALPKSMLPAEIEMAVRALGTDGDAVRGALERSFADYLDERGSYTRRNVKNAGSDVVASMIRLAGRLFAVQLTRRVAAGVAQDIKPPSRKDVAADPGSDAKS